MPGPDVDLALVDPMATCIEAERQAGGPTNLAHAARFVGSPEAAGSGVTVEFDGGVCAPRQVIKAQMSSVSAFDPGPVLGARVTRPLSS